MAWQIPGFPGIKKNHPGNGLTNHLAKLQQVLGLFAFRTLQLHTEMAVRKRCIVMHELSEVENEQWEN